MAAPENPRLSSPRHRPADRQSLLVGLAVALSINGGSLGAIYWYHRHGASVSKKQNEIFVDVKLMKFGKKRDLSFLPHIEAAPRVAEPNKIKVTDNPERPKERPKEQRRPDLSKLFDEVKNMRVDDDDRATRQASEEGDPRGVRGGTANEAAGDPFVLAVAAAIQERWTVPTVLTTSELSRLHASACLKIDDEGRLVEFHIEKPSGNSLFDGSLLSTLGSIKELVKPYGPFARLARVGKFCPDFSKQ